MKIILTKVPTGIHNQIDINIEGNFGITVADMAFITKVVKLVDEYNVEQNEHA